MKLPIAMSSDFECSEGESWREIPTEDISSGNNNFFIGDITFDLISRIGAYENNEVIVVGAWRWRHEKWEKRMLVG